MTLREAHDLALNIMVDAETARDRYWSTEMADNDKLEKVADTIHKMADEAEQSLIRDGYADYQNKPQDRDWRKGYVQACRDNERALRE